MSEKLFECFLGLYSEREKDLPKTYNNCIVNILIDWVYLKPSAKSTCELAHAKL
jgi:hypothetical protein